MKEQRRILIVDDNKSIHDDFIKILTQKSENSSISKLEQVLFQETAKSNPVHYQYIIDSAFQGKEAIDMVEKAYKNNFPYSLIYMDVRMPPGIDGVETIDRIWKNYPNIEMVICSAYSDYSWNEILERFGTSDKLLFVKKPFNVIVIKQLTLSLITKWDIAKKNRSYMEELEEEVQTRTKELKELLIEMKELKEKAEESSRLKSAFLANMSHEIRSPMNSILGFTELLLSKDFNLERRNNYLKLIANSGKSLLHLIDDIIHMAKIEAGVVELENIDFDLNKLFNELLEIFTAEISILRKKKLQLVSDLEQSDGSLFIHADPERIKQVLINLITNALKFTQEGNITFGYKIKHDFIEFFVKDSGIGIPQDKLNTIFERFGQVGDNRQKQVGGTGLGLTISKHLVDLMGGKIWVESRRNGGSTFYFTLPFLKGNEIKPSTITEKKRTRNKKPNKKETILIADDEEPNFILLELFLESPNRKLLYAKNGIVAIKMFKENPEIDIILMDIKMPKMDGVQATQEIKKINPDIPVIAQTAFAMDDDEKELLKKGFNDYIKKPINSSVLTEKVETWLKKK
jgi:signal transduction histidine kinase